MNAAYRKNYAEIDWSQPVRQDNAMPVSRMRGPRSDLPAPIIVSDHMTPGQSQIDGKIYDSRSAYQRHVRETGHEIVGDQTHHLMAENSRAEVADEAGIDRAIKEAIQKHAN